MEKPIQVKQHLYTETTPKVRPKPMHFYLDMKLLRVIISNDSSEEVWKTLPVSVSSPGFPGTSEAHPGGLLTGRKFCYQCCGVQEDGPSWLVLGNGCVCCLNDLSAVYYKHCHSCSSSLALYCEQIADLAAPGWHRLWEMGTPGWHKQQLWKHLTDLTSNYGDSSCWLNQQLWGHILLT